MKMYMPLVATEDGIVQFVKQPGVSLEPGDILGILSLDDPSRVQHARPFDGLLPAMGLPSQKGNKPHQRLAYCLDILHNILDGYDYQAIMATTLKDLITVLHDPDLPFSEASSVLASLTGRMPAKLEDSVRAALESAHAKSGVPEFPAARLKKMLEHFINTDITAPQRPMVRTQLAALFDLTERYRLGLKHHEVETMADLLFRYEETEKLFGGSIEAKVLKLRDQYKDDLDKVAALVLSHLKAQSKSKLVFAILDEVQGYSPDIADAESKLHKALRGLAALESKSVLLLIV